MGTSRFTPEFKEEAVRQITVRGYSVAEVSDRMGVSAHSLYKCRWAIKPDNSEQHTHSAGGEKRDPEARSDNAPHCRTIQTRLRRNIAVKYAYRFRQF